MTKIAFAFAFLLAALAFAADVKIVEDGKSDYIVVVPEKPTPAESLAAGELAKYFKQISGAQLKIEQGGKGPAHSILIAEWAHAQNVSFFNNLGEPPVGETFVIHRDGDRLEIVGGRGRSLLFATYQFLDGLGCRFLAPAFEHYKRSNEVIPAGPTLVVTDAMLKHSAPKLKFRKLYVEEGHSHNAENLKQLVEWMSKVGYNTLVIPTNYQGGDRVKWDNWRNDVTPELQKRDITIEVGGHGYQNFFNAEMEDGQLFTKHPNWFGANAQGERVRAHGMVFCTSNSEAVYYLTKNVIAYLKDRPEIQIFDFWPPDGAKWCQCEKCQALGAPPDRQVLLVNHVKQKVLEVRPDVRLEIIAYAAAVNPPEHQKLDKDVLVDFCPIGQQFDHQINDPAAEKNASYAIGLTAWRKAFDGDMSIYSYYRKYAWDSLPVIIPHYMQKDLQWYAKLPVQGVSCYSEPGDWYTYELNHYTLAALAWDPDVDVNAVVKKFCQARYGDQAAAAQAALMTLEDVTRNTCSVPSTSLKDADHIEADRERVATFVEGLEGAAKSTQDPTIKRNLEKLSLTCQYAIKDLEIQKLRVTQAGNDEIKEKGQELHDFVHAHADDGVFMVKDQRLAIGRLLNRYGLKEKREPGGGRAAATRRSKPATE